MAGAGTVTQSIEHVTTQPMGSGKGGFKIMTFTCVGDASGGGIPATTTSQVITNQIKGCYLLKVQLKVGATAPTANSDVYIKDANGCDLLGGKGVDALDNSANTCVEIFPMVVTQYGRQPVTGALTLTVSNDSVASATYSVILYLVAANSV